MLCFLRFLVAQYGKLDYMTLMAPNASKKDGNSHFDVLIFDLSASQINYIDMNV